MRLLLALVSVPFTSGSSLQLEICENIDGDLSSFSSLYIGILAATDVVEMPVDGYMGFSSLYIGILAATVTLWKCLWMAIWVSVPFTSGSSLQP